jgi:hypothetical protein
VKNFFFLPLPVLWFAEVSSVDSLVSHGNNNSAATKKPEKYSWWLLLVIAGIVAIPLVWAEERRDWLAAQASLVIILLLLALAAWTWWRTNDNTPEVSVAAAIYSRALHKLLVCVAIGIAAVILNAIREIHWEDGLVARAVGYGTLIAGCAFIAGVLLGFLFGVPPASDTPKTPAGSIQPSDKQSPSQPPQTNLEEIADWLTKIIVGAGLASLGRLPGLIGQLSSFVASGVDPNPKNQNPAIALAIMGYFSSCGLLYGYVWTRYKITASSFDSDLKTTLAPSEAAIGQDAIKTDTAQKAA